LQSQGIKKFDPLVVYKGDDFVSKKREKIKKRDDCYSSSESEENQDFSY
jgi:hypothetical protein